MTVACKFEVQVILAARPTRHVAAPGAGDEILTLALGPELMLKFGEFLEILRPYGVVAWTVTQYDPSSRDASTLGRYSPTLASPVANTNSTLGMGNVLSFDSLMVI